MKIAVDFDGTIVDHKYPKIGKTKPFAFETLKALQKQEHDLILWTYRAGKELDDAVQFCKENNIEFYSINSNYPEEIIDDSISRKIYADIYIDDRNIGGFPGWSKIWNAINEDVPFKSDLFFEIPDKEEKPSLKNKIMNFFK
ncbi:MAG: hydrolase [Bacteroidota bacterium]